MKSTPIVACFWLILIAPAVQAESKRDPAAVSILTRANEAASKITALTYRAETRGEGALAGRIANLKGLVTARRPSAEAKVQLRIDAESSLTLADTKPSATIAQNLKFVSNGVTATLLDEGAKVFTTGDAAAAQAHSVQSLFPPRFMRKGAFSDEISAPRISMKGQADVEGAPCDIVEVSYERAGSRPIRYFFGKKDSLLRRIESEVSFRMSGGSNEIMTGSVIFIAHSFDLSPSIVETLFHLECPNGFRRDTFRSAPQPPAAPPAVGSDAPEWELKTPDGRSVSLKSLRGKIVVLDFWATWCGPCKAAMPALQKVHERFKDRPVAVYGVNCWERNPRANPPEVAMKMGVNYGQLLGGDRVASAYGVTGIPTLCVIGADGKVLTIMRGFSQYGEQQLVQLIQQNLPQ